MAFTIPAGEGWGGGSIVDEWFASTTNLYGATVIASVALEVRRPHVPVNVRVYSQGDEASDYSWGTTASRSTATLADLSSFHQIVLHPANRRGNRPYCASATGAIGIQVQRSRSSSVDIPVKLYIKSVVVGNSRSGDTPGKGMLRLVGQGGGSFQNSSTNSGLGGFGGDGYCQLAKNGAISVAADDWVAAGTCQGYGYAYSYGKRLDTKIVPVCDASRCTPALSRISSRGLCANGTIAADPTWGSKVGVGFDFDPSKAGTAGIALTYQMAGTAILRFVLDDGKGGYYCADLDETDESGLTVHLPWNSLTTRCWDRWDPGVAYNPSRPIKGMQLSASCLATKTSWFDMCITGLSTF